MSLTPTPLSSLFVFAFYILADHSWAISHTPSPNQNHLILFLHLFVHGMFKFLPSLFFLIFLYSLLSFICICGIVIVLLPETHIAGLFMFCCPKVPPNPTFLQSLFIVIEAVNGLSDFIWGMLHVLAGIHGIEPDSPLGDWGCGAHPQTPTVDNNCRNRNS